MIKRRIAYVLLLVLLFAAEVYINNKLSLILLCTGIFIPLVSLLLSYLSYKDLSIKLETAETVEKD